MLGGGVVIDGIDLSRAPEQAKAGFGLAIEPHELPASLSGRQYIELVASIRACAPDDPPGHDLIERLDLGRWLDRPIAEYSLGTRAKVAIAATLIGAPALLIFDETLNGLDPVAAWEAKRVMTALAASGRHAIIVSTHVVEAVPALCNRAVLMAEGRLSRDWDAAELAKAGSVPGAFEEGVMQALRTQVAA
ncbi:ATP-binding cassette domain-containing protein [Mesorhizobium sp. ORM8.1]